MTSTQCRVPYDHIPLCTDRKEYQQLLRQHGMVCPMSRKGNCWDNAPTERFFGSLKREWLATIKPPGKPLSGMYVITSATTTRGFKDKTETETRHFISSLEGSDPARLGKAVRAHWSVENNLYWVLDVAFGLKQARAANQQRIGREIIARNKLPNLA